MRSAPPKTLGVYRTQNFTPPPRYWGGPKQYYPRAYSNALGNCLGPPQ